jgi:hypothetical protein
VIRTLAHQAANQPVDSAEMEVDQVGLVVAAVACAVLLVLCRVLWCVLRQSDLGSQAGVLQICKHKHCLLRLCMPGAHSRMQRRVSDAHLLCPAV